MPTRNAEENSNLVALRSALDESEAAVAAGELYDFDPGFLDELDDKERARSASKT